MRFDLDSLEFDHLFEYVKAAKHYKIVEQRGSYYYIDGEKIGQGDRQLREYIASDKELMYQIAETVEIAERK